MKEAKESRAFNACNTPKHVKHRDEDEEFFLGVQEKAEVNNIESHRRYISNKVRKHPVIYSE